jgi:hypothetical protein
MFWRSGPSIKHALRERARVHAFLAKKKKKEGKSPKSEFDGKNKKWLFLETKLKKSFEAKILVPYLTRFEQISKKKMLPNIWCKAFLSARPGNTKGGSITVPLTSCLTGLD